MMEEDKAQKQRILTLLKALKEASRDLHSNPFSFIFKNNTHFKDTIEAFLNLQAKSVAIFNTHPNLRHLSDSLSTIKTLIENLQKFKGFGLRSLIHRQITLHKISQLSNSFESEIQHYLDYVTVRDLVKTMEQGFNEEEQVKVLVEFQQRLSQGFDLDFQDLILKARVFSILEGTLIETKISKRVQEEAAMAIAGLVKFNRNVFVGLVLMSPTIKALITMASSVSIRVLCSLVSFVRSPLVDEILCNGEIPRIVRFLCCNDLSLKVAGFDCVLELGYIGRREVIEAMLEEDLIKILVDLQRREGLLNGRMDDDDFDFDSPFASCVSRFAIILLEAGEGLTSEEKREVKLKILKMVMEASQSDVEAATISAEILWGSSH
ncbi:hypothetical protein Lal_00002309 [Lupinus albus]|uniref:Uncharacterized protein n=1 Tax=Lupinus albus TaxID=3870 RepID=A0A6A4PQC3_LUPAL|nr:hypothetical protein Lalb_Chr11g0063651 [Lupinus albus]KAF1893781.1 hypothetical protein Lal_00002309 [Lupinus albus]